MLGDWLLILPVILPLALAVALLLLRHQKQTCSWLAGAGSAVTLAGSVGLVELVLNSDIVASDISAWPAPFGITLVADRFSAALILISGIIGAACVCYAIADLHRKPSYAVFLCFFQVLLAGVNGAFLTGDIFNLYVWFEVMIIASFGLMVLDADRYQIDGAVKYVVLNLIATLSFLLAIGLFYGAVGTLNMADLHGKAHLLSADQKMLLSALFLFGFAIKAALFPVFAWLPASYHTLPSAVVALFAALLTKVGVYALIRYFTIVVPLEESGWQDLMLWLAGLTMLIGVLGAACQNTVKRILSFHIISQIGYMIMGLALFTPLALAGAIFYIIHHIIVKANLFLIAGVLQRWHGTESLAKLGGAYKSAPWLSVLFLIPAFSLAGFPPLSGFWGKFMVIKSSLLTEHYTLAATALVVGLLTAFSMSKIWAEAFWKAAPAKQKYREMTRPEAQLYVAPIAVLALLTLIIGLSAEPLFRFAEQSAHDLLNPTLYVDTVLGRRG